MSTKGALLKLYKEGVAPADQASMEARYDFSDGSGSTLTDSSGNSKNGTITNATWAVGTTGFTSGNSLSFDGNGDYVTLPTGLLVNQAAITYEGFVRLTPGQETETRYLFVRSNGIVSDQIYIQGNTNKLVVDLGSITSRPTVTTNYIFTPNVWYHICIVWDSAEAVDTDRLKVYINSDEDTATPSTGSGSTSNTGTFTTYISSTTTAAWYGNISFVALHNAALSASDVSTRFQAAIKKSGNYICDTMWQMVEEITLTASSRWQDFQYYLDGDQDGAYKIEAFINGNTSGTDSNYQLSCNGVLVGADISWVYQTSTTTVSASLQSATADTILSLDVTTARQGYAEWLMEFPETGKTRYTISDSTHRTGGANRVEKFIQVSTWNTPGTSTKIRTLGIHATQALGLISGTKLRLYKLKFSYEQ